LARNIRRCRNLAGNARSKVDKSKSSKRGENCTLCSERCRLDAGLTPGHHFRVGQGVVVQKALKGLAKGSKGKVVGVCRKPLGAGQRYKRRGNYVLVELGDTRHWINHRNLKVTA
jgi:hypothetical protein